MKRTIVTLNVVFAALVLAILLGTPRGQTSNSSAAIAAPSPVPMAVPVPARCPRIHEALETLESTEKELNEASHDFCGQKVDAVRSVRDAIGYLRKAENCDKCR